MKQERQILATAALLAAISVVAGAFGAHGLKEMVPAESVASFQTAARYLLIHSIALIGITALPRELLSPRRKKTLFVLVLIGTLLFSGSIFLLVFNKIWQIEGLRLLGPVTPIGGLLLIVSWLFLFWITISKRQ